ncbi:MAG TPA: alpha/beta hydrolase [Terriglobales bacterium]|nr:alpha/beta hydrolase [Terriglobales bacterium]
MLISVLVRTRSLLVLAALVMLGTGLVFGASEAAPTPLGKFVALGGHRLHVNCTGKGSPTVVVENGLGDFSFDWVLVQTRVSRFTRICTYDRAGYAWSDPGPKPRTFAQLNLELRDALGKLGERGPFVLVGHSYGGPVVRNFAITYPKDVAAVVLVDAAFEGQRVGIGGGKTLRLGEDAKGEMIPKPRESMGESDKAVPGMGAGVPSEQALDPVYRVLPPEQQKMRLWAQAQPQIEDAENSQRHWSSEYFAKWLAAPETAKLGAIPLLVLTRAEGGYGSGQDIPAEQLEKERKEGQAKLALLSSNGKQVIVRSGHDMELEAPDDVAAAIRRVVDAVRKHGAL